MEQKPIIQVEMIALFNKLTSPFPIVRQHPLLCHPGTLPDPRERNFNNFVAQCEASSFRRLPNAGYYRYSNSDRIRWRIFKYPLPIHTRTPGWRAEHPLWLRVDNGRWPVGDPNHVRVQHAVTRESRGFAYIFVPSQGAKLLRSPDRKPGLADVTRATSRIKSFKLSHALMYSYRLDLRFSLITCLLLGFSVWWLCVPDQVLEAPRLLWSPHLAEGVKRRFYPPHLY